VDRDTEYGAVPREYIQDGLLDGHDRVELFVQRIQHYDGGVHRCVRGAVAETIAGALSARVKRRLLVPEGFPAEWLPRGFEFVTETNLSYTALDASDGVITTCTAAIATTGTIILCHGAGEGRRAATLIPDYHLCLVEARSIVETVPEGVRRIAAMKPRLVTTISGPSATSDIEMTRIKGVHGPRTLEVVVVS
jgi:L-lactate dehydrogenase complex protein LldG